jgi:hypothetical protein
VLKHLCSYSMHSALLGDLGGRKSRSGRSAARPKTATMHFVPVPRRVLLIAEFFFRAVIKVASRNASSRSSSLRSSNFRQAQPYTP